MEKQILLVFGLLLFSVNAVKINRIQVPKKFELNHDGNDTIVLECDFTVNSSDTGFVLKWLHNNVQIYQWIPSKNVPFAMGAFKNRIDLVKQSSDDRLKKHSALIINNPLLTDTGNYTCNVQTFQGSDKQTAEMQIIDPEDSIKLEYEFKPNNTVEFTCSVSKIFPIPTLKLLFDNEEKESSVEIEEHESEGVADVKITASVPRSEIVDESPVICELSISDYTKKETIIYDENDAKVLQGSFLMMALALSMALLTSWN